MSLPKHVQPERGLDAFTCPQCGVLSRQVWRKYFREARRGAHAEIDYFAVSICTACEGPMFWFKDRIIDPDTDAAPPPNPDLSDDIRRDYAEAASVATRSPRAAAALLRLAVWKLGIELGQPGDSVEEDIVGLISRGLTPRMRLVLDEVRVVGQDAVAPGALDARDDAETVGLLFTIVNLIADEMVSRPKYLDDAYKRLGRRKGSAAADTDLADEEP